MSPPVQKTVKWTLIAFIAFSVLLAGLAVWQLAETRPALWCVIAQQGSPETSSSCYNVLVKLLEIKQLAVTILLSALVVSNISVVVVVLGVRIKGEGPAGVSVDVSTQSPTVTVSTSEGSNA